MKPLLDKGFKPALHLERELGRACPPKVDEVLVHLAGATFGGQQCFRVDVV